MGALTLSLQTESLFGVLCLSQPLGFDEDVGRDSEKLI